MLTILTTLLAHAAPAHVQVEESLTLHPTMLPAIVQQSDRCTPVDVQQNVVTCADGREVYLGLSDDVSPDVASRLAFAVAEVLHDGPFLTGLDPNIAVQEQPAFVERVLQVDPELLETVEVLDIDLGQIIPPLVDDSVGWHVFLDMQIEVDWLNGLALGGVVFGGGGGGGANGHPNPVGDGKTLYMKDFVMTERTVHPNDGSTQSGEITERPHGSNAPGVKVGDNDRDNDGHADSAWQRIWWAIFGGPEDDDEGGDGITFGSEGAMGLVNIYDVAPIELVRPIVDAYRLGHIDTEQFEFQVQETLITHAYTADVLSVQVVANRYR